MNCSFSIQSIHRNLQRKLDTSKKIARRQKKEVKKAFQKVKEYTWTKRALEILDL